MKEFTYIADGGGIVLGNENFSVRYPNGYGDGTFSLYVINDGEMHLRTYKYKGSVKGKFNVYKYDYSTDEILVTLEGRYGVYVDEGTVVLEKFGGLD